MSIRTVRLDEEAEKALNDIINAAGITISAALKRGLLVYRDEVLKETKRYPRDFFEEFDLGEGGYALAPARDAGKAVKQIIRNKSRR